MPTYDYECDKCEHTFEAFQSMTEKPIRVCPECKSRKVRRLIGTGAAIIFKGSGFYSTDYRSQSDKAREKAETSSASGAGTKNGAKKKKSKD